MHDVKNLHDLDQKQRLDNFQRRMLKSVFYEYWTPIERNLNVDMKMLRKHVDDGMNLSNEDHRLIILHSQEIEKINNSILRTLKNTNNENKMLDREIERMQRIDRVKVAHAKTSIFVPEMGNVFPSLDMYYAANKTYT